MIAILIPCYNETNRFPKAEFYSFVSILNNKNIHFYLINDGSSDNTGGYLTEIASSLKDYNVHCIDNKINQGKAEAIRTSLDVLKKEDFTYFAYLDADFATHPSEILAMYEILRKDETKLFAMGARWQRLGAEINRNTARHYFGRFFATLASIVLELKVYDTQCGAKVIHHSLIDSITNEKFISKWLFDVEILARIIKQQGKSKTEASIIEYPLSKWTEIGGSKIKLTDLLKVPVELFKIYQKY